MRENMSGDNNATIAARKKRVQILKKLIVLTLAISIIVPWVMCILLFERVQGLQRDLQTVSTQLQEFSVLLENFSRESNTRGQGSAPIVEAGQEEVQEEAETDESISPVVNVIEQEPARKVYLTFDDGPSIYTEDILDILDQYDVKATFFVVGKEDENSKELLRQIVDRGHTLGMHSYSHVYRDIYRSVDSFAEDFVRIQEYLFDITGVRSYIYRFPGGSSNKVSDIDMREFAEYLSEQEVEFFDWNASSGDGSGKLLSVQEIVKNCMKDVESQENVVILLHDSGDKRTTVEALPIVIENILALEDTEILPITEETEPVQHISMQTQK